MRKQNRKLSGKSEPMAFAPVVRGENRLEVLNAGDTAEIVLLGAIGKSWWDDSGITEKEFRNALNAIPSNKPITVKVNSEGGSVQEGLGIYNAIKERSQDITCEITGYALSIASVFPLAASKVVSPKSAIWMIHCAWSWASGNAADMRKQAEMLDKHDETILAIYEENTGKSRSELKAAMEKETWFTGPEAVDFGLADETDKEGDAHASLRPLSPEYVKRCINAHPTLLAAVNRGTPTKTVKQPVTTSANSFPTPQGAVEMQPTAAGNSGAQPNKTMPENNATAAAQPAAENDVLAKLQARLDTERKARITSEVNRRAENKITNKNLDWWINAAMADEAGTLAQIDALPSDKVGHEPFGPSGVELGDDAVLAGYGPKPTPMIENIFKTKPGNDQKARAARFDEIKANWRDIIAEAQRKDGNRDFAQRGYVFNSNTYSATLTTSFLIMGATTKLSPKFAAIAAFSRDVSVDPYKPLATGVMKFTSSAQDGSTTQTNATNFESSTQVVDAVSITLSQYTNSGSISNSDLNSGIRTEDISRAVLMGLGAKVMAVVTAPITTTNFTATPVTAALDPSAFGFAESRLAYSRIKYANTRNLILDVEYAAGLLNQPSLFQPGLVQQNGPGHWTNVFGWDNVYENTIWPSGENAHGFGCDPQAVGVIAGLPAVVPAGIPGGILSTSTGVIPGAELPISAYLWFNTASRTYWFSYDSVVGASKLDATAGVVIKSA